MKQSTLLQTLVITSAMATAIRAHAQPIPEVPIPPDSPPEGEPPAPEPVASTGTPAPVTVDPYTPPVPRPALPPIDLPEVLTTPTGWLLPAAVLYSKTSLDTGGGVTADLRVGLGDVAEFGLATIDSVRDRTGDPGDDGVDRIQPYVAATVRLGVAEHRLFRHQPGLALGFRKSFERDHAGFTTRVAELTLVASAHLGKHAAIHVGGAFWDASLAGDLDGTGATEVTLHDLQPAREQVRAFGGLEVRPLPRSQILIDLGWAPEFCYRCADAEKITLKPVLSWGVRYDVARFMHLESGVRLPDIGDANLLEAQIFGQVTFTSFALRRAIESLK
jgi:hypothetical protein